MKFWTKKQLLKKIFIKNKRKNKNIHDLNFNQTFFEKDSKNNFVSHLNINNDEDEKNE